MEAVILGKLTEKREAEIAQALGKQKRNAI